MQLCRIERASGIINITLIKSDIAWMEDLGWRYTEKQLADVHWLHRKVFSWAIKSARSSWFTLEFQFVASLNKHSAQLLKQSVWFNSRKENIYSLRINRHTIYGLYFVVCIYSNPPTQLHMSITIASIILVSFFLTGKYDRSSLWWDKGTETAKDLTAICLCYCLSSCRPGPL